MIKVLYCNEGEIINALAESLVIGGLPMNDKVPTQEGLTKEIEELAIALDLIWSYKDYFEFNKELKQIRLKESLVNKGFSDEYVNHICEGLDVYCKRGRTLGNVPVGSGHNSLFKGVQFNMIIKFPLYWLKEYQRYHFTDIISSQSTMHKILKFNLEDMFSDEVDPRCISIIKELKCEYEQEEDKDKKRQIWRKIINSCPDGLHMVQGITMNYLQLTTIIPQRRNHKLKEEWGAFCKFFESLPFYDFFLQ